MRTHGITDLDWILDKTVDQSWALYANKFIDFYLVYIFHLICVIDLIMPRFIFIYIDKQIIYF